MRVLAIRANSVFFDKNTGKACVIGYEILVLYIRRTIFNGTS